MPRPDAVDTAPLDEQLRHPLLRPGDAGYDEAREVWNARFRRSPAVVARCASADEVAAAVRFARGEGLPLSVKGGGHDYAGNTVAEGGLLIDLGPMRSVEVDPDDRRATVGAGATWAEVDAATQAHGLATPGATVSSVGVGGFTLGGGAGWLLRKHGLAADNLLAAEVVTAAGDVVRASPDENADLHWALRGGGGNFGVVTSFEYRLHPVGPEVLAGQVLYPFERAAELLRVYRDVFRDAADETMCYPFFIRIPPLDVFPEAFHGKVVLDFVVAYTGRVADGEAHLAPFREQGEPIMDVVAPQPYVALQQAFDAGMAKGSRWYSRSRQLDELEDDAIETLVSHLEPFPGAMTAVYLGPLGGAATRPAPGDAAYPHRSPGHELHVFPGWTDPGEDAEAMAWADRLHEAMGSHATRGVYVNLLGDGETDRVEEAYGPNHGRLRELKRVWDPGNLFRGNHNIPPA